MHRAKLSYLYGTRHGTIFFVVRVVYEIAHVRNLQYIMCTHEDANMGITENESLNKADSICYSDLKFYDTDWNGTRDQ